MLGFLISFLILWAVYKYAPHGDKIIAVILCMALLKIFGIIPNIIFF